jgi:hypothetical protein
MEYDPSIDKDNLDEESVYVPATFDVFSRKEAEASQYWDSLKDKMKVLQADIELEIRGWPIEKINSFFQKGIPKLTESVYKSLVLIHPEVIELYQEIEQARYDVKMYEAARKSIERKAEGLDRLAKLHGQGYFMKVEGRAYVKKGIDATLERVKKTIMRRATAPTPPSPTGTETGGSSPERKAPAKAKPVAKKKAKPKAKPVAKRVPPKRITP